MGEGPVRDRKVLSLLRWKTGWQRLRAEKGLRTFFRVWTGQVVSVLGSGLSDFAAGVWVYQQTGSVTNFALTIFAVNIPGLLILPFQGPLVDRMDRRKLMLLADAGQGLCTLVLLALLVAGQLQVWHVWLMLAISGIFSAGHELAWVAATTLLVPRQHLGRINGMLQLGPSVSRVLSPVLAGGLFAWVGLAGVLAVDLLTFLIALLTLSGVTFPAPARRLKEAGEVATGLLRQVALGWRYIAERPGLKRLLLLLNIINLGAGMASALVTPLVLSFADVEVVGLVISIHGAGLVLGSTLLTVWGGPKDRILAVLGFGVLLGLCLILSSLHPSAILVAVAGFGWLLAVPFISGCSQVVWQTKTPAELQGRVFAVRATLARAATPVALLTAGPLADRLAGPLSEGGALANTLGRIVGVGDGRGTAALLFLAGIGVALPLASGFLSPRLRRLDQEVPDAPEEDDEAADEAVEELSEAAPAELVEERPG